MWFVLARELALTVPVFALPPVFTGVGRASGAQGAELHATCRAVDSSGATIDFLLSAKQAAAKRFLAKALGRANHPTPRVINTDKHAAYPPAIVQLKDEGVLEENCQHRPVQYLNNVLEQDYRAIKRRVPRADLF